MKHYVKLGMDRRILETNVGDVDDTWRSIAPATVLTTVEDMAASIFEQQTGVIKFAAPSPISPDIETLLVMSAWIGEGSVGAILFFSRVPVALTSLTSRERDVFVELGLTGAVKQAALNVEISPHTARTHVRGVMSKSRLESTGEVITAAVQCASFLEWTDNGGWKLNA